MATFNGVKRIGCSRPQCQTCALVRARAKVFGPTNVYVGVTRGELARLQRTPGLKRLALRVTTAATRCLAEEPPLFFGVRP